MLANNWLCVLLIFKFLCIAHIYIIYRFRITHLLIRIIKANKLPVIVLAIVPKNIPIRTKKTACQVNDLFHAW